ncbi:ABC transporter ATP-binding protein [Jannaschia seohaensis]|uniref:ATP-binding cassette subfamily B protein n=1 Tax=Jannaschia seohaensis TaxID=475081 RepID=A0A2Y9AZX3_9RHOB|nr:ABC transporter ATP-binding protein [Jannaschia seohaensis]PWJ16521.1 ATP-binding cassette subfamily B protein [Jannaschia seohaensis]SSA48758.1 ATP-binding cassette, subfamily B [Jannaschia seohaensis]
MSRLLRHVADRFAGLVPAFAPAEGAPPRDLLAFFRWCLHGAWPWLIVAFGASALAGTTEIATAFFLGAVIDSVAGETEGYLARNALLLGGFMLFYLLLRPLTFGASAAFNGITVMPNVYPLVQSRLHRWTMGQSVTFFDNDFAGRIATKQMQTARAVTEVTNEFINVVAFASASLIGSLLLMFAIDWRIALALGIWLVGYVALFRWFMPRIRTRSKARAAARAMVTGQVVDTITNIKTVKLFGHAEHEDRSALDAMATLRERALAFGRMSTSFRFMLMFCAGLLPILMIGGSVLLWQAGQATAGDIAAAGAISFRLSQMTGWVSFTLMALYANVGEVEDGMHTLAHLHALTDAPDAHDLPRLDGAIRLEDVTFTYGRDEGGISGFDLTVAPGEKIGVVGASGAGKSTLVALLLRLYDPEEGRITVDGHDLREVTQDSLRRQIGMVTQETAMFNRSARDNILYGRPDASEEEIIDAARRAEAHDFIEGLRDHKGNTGYDAFLGERGVKLSGGQRQRIALARAILKDAPVLVLDEATSALDSEVEAAIQSALEQVMEGKTVIAIAHRLSTIARMDRIVVMEAGRIVEQGTHRQLLAKGGTYARYWERQSGGFIGVEDVAAE